MQISLLKNPDMLEGFSGQKNPIVEGTFEKVWGEIPGPLRKYNRFPHKKGWAPCLWLLLGPESLRGTRRGAFRYSHPKYGFWRQLELSSGAGRGDDQEGARDPCQFAAKAEPDPLQPQDGLSGHVCVMLVSCYKHRSDDAVRCAHVPRKRK